MNVKNIGLIAGAVLKIAGEAGLPFGNVLGMTVEGLLQREGYDATGKAPEVIKAELMEHVAAAANFADEETDALLVWFPELRNT